MVDEAFPSRKHANSGKRLRCQSRCSTMAFRLRMRVLPTIHPSLGNTRWEPWDPIPGHWVPDMHLHNFKGASFGVVLAMKNRSVNNRYGKRVSKDAG
jgi:hypothetical protein